MTRELFKKVATVTLRRLGVPDPAAAAESIAIQMDIMAETMGEDVPATTTESPRAGFPAPNPEAVMPAASPLIIPATRIPDRGEVDRAREAQRPTPIPKGVGRMKVEHLSQWVQDNTPNSIPIEVRMEDGSIGRMSFVRNVISMHASDSVQLIYYPANATPSAREASEVISAIHVDDAGEINLQEIVKKLQHDAAEYIRPKGRPREVPVRPYSGPVRHNEDNYQNQDLQNQTSSIFQSLPEK